MGDARHRRGRHRSRADASHLCARPRRRQCADPGHAAHAVPDRLDLEVVRRPGRDARGRGRPPRPARAGDRLPPLAPAPDGGRAGHAAPPPLAHERAAGGNGGDAVDGRRSAPAGPDRAVGARPVPLLEPRLLDRRARPRAGDREADRGRAPRERARARRDDRHRAGDHELPAGAARGRLCGGRPRAAVAPGAAAGAGDLGRVGHRRRQHLLDRRGHGGLRTRAPERRRWDRGTLELRARDDARRRARGRLRLRLRARRRGARGPAADRPQRRDDRLQLGARRRPGRGNRRRRPLQLGRSRVDSREDPARRARARGRRGRGAGGARAARSRSCIGGGCKRVRGQVPLGRRGARDPGRRRPSDARPRRRSHGAARTRRGRRLLPGGRRAGAVLHPIRAGGCRRRRALRRTRLVRGRRLRRPDRVRGGGRSGAPTRGSTPRTVPGCRGFACSFARTGSSVWHRLASKHRSRLWAGVASASRPTTRCSRAPSPSGT